jgi:excisionase family DNA binding protein
MARDRATSIGDIMSLRTTEDDGAQRLKTARQAAAYLAISERHLWTITQKGGLCCTKLGRSVRYDTVELNRYIAANQRGGRRD